MIDKMKPGGGSPGLVSGVTAETFEKIGAAFMGAKGEGSVVALANGENQGVKYHQTLPQWGAWLAYRRRKKLSTSFMEAREFFTVPAEWPYLFDATSLEMEDTQAGIEFEMRWLNAKRPLVGDPRDPKPLKPRTMAEARPARLAAHEPHRPFPQLWSAFANDPDAIAWLDRGGWTHDTLAAAAKVAVNAGAHDAALFLERSRAPEPKPLRSPA